MNYFSSPIRFYLKVNLRVADLQLGNLCVIFSLISLKKDMNLERGGINFKFASGRES